MVGAVGIEPSTSPGVAAIVWRKICDTGTTAATIEARLDLAATIALRAYAY